MGNILDLPMGLVPIVDPDRIREIWEDAGLTPEIVERRKKEFADSLEHYYRKHPDARPKSSSLIPVFDD